MSGQRAPNKNDNCMGWNGVPHSDQNSSSTSAQYAPKGKGKSVTASGFTQSGAYLLLLTLLSWVFSLLTILQMSLDLSQSN
jgi:hypothetical protein